MLGGEEYLNLEIRAKILEVGFKMLCSGNPCVCSGWQPVCSICAAKRAQLPFTYQGLSLFTLFYPTDLLPPSAVNPLLG